MAKKKRSTRTKTIAKKTEGMVAHEGFFTFYWDEMAGKIWLEIGRFDEGFIYVSALSAGLGSNDVGLDRNQLGKTRLVEFVRIGPKVLMVEPNPGYRALSDNPDEVKAVEDAFARAVIWGFEVSAEEDGTVLVDATDFLLHDEKDVIARLKQRSQGEYELDASRSAIWMPEARNFPLNTELEALLTYMAKGDPGPAVSSVAVEPKLLTMRQHHSFVKLPDDGYTPRAWDPRSNYGAITYNDYSTPVDEPIAKRFIRRHRLQKADPTAEVSDPVEPIVYYVDRGVPEPIRTALVEGAAWWNQAFEAIGFRNAFQAKVLPEGADPLDIRYNIINWVHRSTRGWSYGGGVTDPRTGQIIKGQVALGSLRIRQDFMIAQGLVADYEEGGASEMMEMAMARIRQLSVHEVGHTLGLGHNYASHVNGRSSVMDYPAPLVKIGEDGALDLTEAYDHVGDAFYADAAVAEFEIALGHLHHVRGDGENLCLHLVARLDEGAGCGDRASAGDGAVSHRHRRRVGQGHDDLVDGNAPCLGDDLREHGFVPLPLRAGPGCDHDHAGGIDPNGGALERPDAGAFDVAAQPQPEITAFLQRFLLAGAKCIQPADLFDGAPQGFGIIAAVVNDGHAVAIGQPDLVGHLVGPDHVAQPNLRRLEIQRVGHQIDHALHRERDLGPARPAIGRVRRPVGNHQPGVGLVVRDVVGPEHMGKRIADDGGADRRISA